MVRFYMYYECIIDMGYLSVHFSDQGKWHFSTMNYAMALSNLVKHKYPIVPDTYVILSGLEILHEVRRPSGI